MSDIENEGALAWNREAVFRSGEKPSVEVAGVLVFVYVNDDGELVVSVDFDTADPALGDPVPVEVTMSGEQVWSAPGEHPHDHGDYSDVQ